jgi:hypothetical protein
VERRGALEDWCGHDHVGVEHFCHLPLPLSERDVVFIGTLLDHLLAGTTHLGRYGKVA